jgi:hypothetical protein
VAETLANRLLGRAGSPGVLAPGAGMVLGWLARGTAEAEPQIRDAWQRFVARRPFWH